MKSEKLGNIIHISKGKKHSIAEIPSDVSKRLISIDDLRNNNDIKYTNDAKGTEAHSQDILIAWDGANAGTIGYGKTGFIGSTIARLRIKEKGKYYSPFLGTFLQTQFSYLRKTATGATIPHISRSALEKIKLPAIKYEDQIRIATLLSRVEELIAKRKESIRLLDDLLKSTFGGMFGDPKLNSKRFPIRRLSEFYISPKDGTKCGPFGSALKKDEYTSEGIPVWTMYNISEDGRFNENGCLWISLEKYLKLISYKAQNGDIIISRAGTVGKMCIVKSKYDKSLISTNLIRLRLNKDLLPIYFVSLMMYCKGRVGRLKTGPDGAFTHMNTTILDKLSFPYPPIELQKQFSQIVEKVEALKTKYESSLRELENLYGSLSQRAFRGELDLTKIPIRHELEVHDGLHIQDESLPTVLSEHTEKYQLTVDGIKALISRKLPKQFAFETLWETLSEFLDTEEEEENDSIEGNELKNYETAKGIVYKLLDGPNPFLNQILSHDKKEKKIVLELAR